MGCLPLGPRPGIEAYLGQTDNFCYVSKDAGPIAGFGILRNIKAPFTTAIVYGLNKVLVVKKIYVEFFLARCTFNI